MRRSYPSKAQIYARAEGSAVTFELKLDEHTVPNEVEKWLESQGWCEATYDPDTLERLYTNGNYPNHDATGYFRWYEAVAFEMFFFMTLGGQK